ncbi:TPR repeat-containing protein [Calothrix parasitica NIES-267]|uniref:TPR repeat-containing protein n=1 Tax=Calothrix parasitica NIES-267 TaxID=1973488 RepID=A0A1Z4M047_9CYAN|nr:TPR repeat-containing protein [Calothrix parasitica NIES-267]
MLQRKYEDKFVRNKYAEELLIRITKSESNFTDAVTIHGQAGSGKSSLSKSLYNKVAQHYSKSTVIKVEEILKDYVISNPKISTLLKLREDFLKNQSCLNCFDIAYLLYGGLVNSAESINISPEVVSESQCLQIIEVVKQGLYQFPLLLEANLSIANYQSQQQPDAALFGSKIFASLNWFFIQQTEEMRQWWKLTGSNNLQELKDCANLKDFLNLLPLFLARDLQLYLQQFPQKAVAVIDNYESFADAEGQCEWLKDLIKINPSILWIIFAEKPLHLTSNSENFLIQNLTDAESKEILQKFDIENLEISQAIVQASEGFPLYLKLGIETYLSLTKQKTLEVKDFAVNIQEILPKLKVAWDWNERRIWQILSNCQSWDKVLFVKLMSHLKIFSCDWICDCWDKLFNEVVKSSFVELHAEEFCLHPIVGEYLYKNQPTELQQSVNSWLSKYYQDKYQQSELNLGALVKFIEHSLKSPQYQKVTDWFFEQIKLLSETGKHQFVIYILQIFLQSQQNAFAWSLLGKSLFALENYQQAVIALQKAEKLWEAEKNLENLLLSTVHLQLAACYLIFKRTSDASLTAKKALSIRSTKFNYNSVEIADVLKLQTEIAVIEGKYSEALKLSQKVLQIFESHHNISNLQLTQIKFIIAWLNALNKNLHTAEKLFKETLNHLDTQNHSLTIYCHGMLADIYQNMGYFNYQQAYEKYELALESAEINLGLTHPQTLKFIAAIISFSRIRGEYDTVDILTQRRHANMEISNFEETPAVAQRLNRIGCLLYQQGKYAFSEHLLQQALQINCRVLSEQHPQTAESFHNLGLIHKSQRRYHTAEVYFKQAFQIRSQLLGEEHPITASSINSLAALYCCMGKYQQAEPLLQQALEICQQNFGEMHPHTATTLNNLAQMYFCQGLNIKAQPMFQRALDTCQQVLGEEHPYTKTVESNLRRLLESN